MSDSDIAIRVEGFGKKYRLGLTHRGTHRDALHGLGRRLAVLDLAMKYVADKEAEVSG